MIDKEIKKNIQDGKKFDDVKELIDDYGMPVSSFLSLEEDYKIFRLALEVKNFTLLKDLLKNRAPDRIIEYENSLVDNDRWIEETCLHVAIKGNLKEATELLLQRGARVCLHNFHGDAPIHLACKYAKCDPEIVKLLLDHGASVHCKNRGTGETPLMLAARSKNKEVIKILIGYGADRDDASQSAALHVALESKDLDMIRMILNGHYLRGDYARPSDGRTLLHRAIDLNLCDVTFDILLDHGANPNARRDNDLAPLHQAILAGKKSFVKMLLAHGADVNAPTSYNLTPLHLAALRDLEEHCKLLLDYGANINALCQGGKTPLLYAIERQHEKCIDFLLDYGADVNIRSSDGTSVLSLAVARGSHELISKLLSFRPNAQDWHASCRWKESDVSKDLVKYGITLGEKDLCTPTLLHRCVERGFDDAAKTMLAQGADPNVLPSFEESHLKDTLLFKAIELERDEILEVLVEYNVDLRSGYLHSDAYKSPLHHALMKRNYKMVQTLLATKEKMLIRDWSDIFRLAISEEMFEACRLLLEHGLDPNQRDKRDQTPLHYAASIDVSEGAETKLVSIVKIVEFLLSYGAKIDAKRYDDRTALHLSILRGNRSLAETLVRRGADVNMPSWRNNGKPIHLAAQHGFAGIADILLSNGAEVDEPFAGGQTPMHIAIEEGSLELVKILLKYTSGIDSRDKLGRTALHVAIDCRQPKMVELMLDCGPDINLKNIKGQTPLGLTMKELELLGNSERGSDPQSPQYLKAPTGSSTHKLEQIAYCIKKHIVKLDAAKIHVNAEDLAQLADSTRRYETCRAELEKMDAIPFVGAMTLFNFLSMNTVSYLGSELPLEELESIDYKGLDIYGKLLKSKLEKDRVKFNLIKNVASKFNAILQASKNPILPVEVIEKILKNDLSIVDLRNFKFCINNL